MYTEALAGSLTALFAELTTGTVGAAGYILNRGDAGLLKSLAKLSAAEASHSVDGGATIAAHADHLRYGISLMNRWASGEQNPWRDADWEASWRISTVDDARWTNIREALGDEVRRWQGHLREEREVSEMELNGVIGSVAHLAYHLGAIRQIDRNARGPREGGT